MAAFSQDGKVVNLKDRVSVTALVISFTGIGGTALMTLQPSTSLTTFVAQANDCNSQQRGGTPGLVATSISGKNFGTSDNCTALGYVTAISGTGKNAILTITLVTSGRSVTVPAGSVRSVADVS